MLEDLPAKLAKHRELKTLVIDLERVPGVVRAYDAKVNYLGEPMWESLPRTACFAAKWLGAKEIEFAALWNGFDEEALARRSFELFDEADLVVTYFGTGADVPWLRELWAKYGLGEPSTWKDIDLFKVIKSRFRLVHRNLDAACRLVGVGGKTDKYDFRLCDAAIAGDEKAQRKIQRYNSGDVRATEALHWALLPYVKSYPHVRPDAEDAEKRCPRCGSDRTERTALYRPAVYCYVERRCLSCKGPFKTEYHHRGPSVRAL